jgi:hypothetical protein
MTGTRHSANVNPLRIVLLMQPILVSLLLQWFCGLRFSFPLAVLLQLSSTDC